MSFSISVDSKRARLGFLQSELEGMGYSVELEGHRLLVDPLSTSLMFKTWGTAFLLGQIEIALSEDELRVNLVWRQVALVTLIILVTVAGASMLSGEAIRVGEWKQILRAMIVSMLMLSVIVYLTLVSTIKRDVKRASAER